MSDLTSWLHEFADACEIVAAGRWPGPRTAARLREVADALTAAQQQGQAVACTCPSGDGSLRWPCPAHPPTEPFVVRHYTSEEGPTIKGNGFDGLRIGDDRAEAEDFVRWVNAALAKPPAPPSAPVGALGQQSAAVAPTTAECPHDWGQDEAHDAWARCYKCGISRRKPLAQQPAAVDEATARRILAQYLASDPGDAWPPERQGEMRVQALQTAINSALAAQHQAGLADKPCPYREPKS